MLRLVSNTCVAALLATSTVVIGQAGQADIIFVGAKVVTAEPSQPIAEAIALAGDRIRAVGSIEEIRRLAGVQTRSVNRIADKLGTIAEGKLADLVILNGDFLQDFSALHRPIAVLKEGRLVHGTLPER